MYNIYILIHISYVFILMSMSGVLESQLATRHPITSFFRNARQTRRYYLQQYQQHLTQYREMEEDFKLNKGRVRPYCDRQNNVIGNQESKIVEPTHHVKSSRNIIMRYVCIRT